MTLHKEKQKLIKILIVTIGNQYRTEEFRAFWGLTFYFAKNSLETFVQKGLVSLQRLRFSLCTKTE